ncbi:DUF937 domain-containing protein [Nakamurella flava]|uniref:DUF937 domain-containing protein n=1 Tax=Nakamurella flava TaxID=2576308 RepID=A0A4U6QFA9_9ACTN|nr:DUF937 domain-containing protein [Nakamurella flava]TKV58840.1 DUF937 domain-containing protein [Nakamurella flava]
MTAVDDLLGQLPMGELANKLGVDEATAEQAAKTALPTLLAGLQANAEDPAGAQSLESALAQHQDSSLLDGGVSLDQVDEADGEKIVGNVFGDKKSEVVNALGGLGGLGGGDGGGDGGGQSGLISKLLPMLAPIVMAYLAKQFFNKGQGGEGSADGGGLAGMLGGLLGGGSGGAGGGGLGGMLGGLLGGGGSGGAGGGLGGMLGGLLGGGKR